MTLNPILLSIWIVLALCLLGLLMYRGQLTRYEEDQLFLNESADSNEAKQQSEIIRRVNRIQPFIRICGGAAGLATASIVGLYIYDAWRRLQ
jgi:hypothetical protein